MPLVNAVLVRIKAEFRISNARLYNFIHFDLHSRDTHEKFNVENTFL